MKRVEGIDMANANGYGTDSQIDDPLAELERLVNARTARMERSASGNADSSWDDAAPVLTDQAAQSEPVIDEHALDFALRGALENDPLVSGMAEPVVPSEPSFDSLLPSLAALRGSWSEETGASQAFPPLSEPVSEQMPEEAFDAFDAEINSAVQSAVTANDSALAVLAAQSIDADVPPTTVPIDVPDLPAFDAVEPSMGFEAEFERELADELYVMAEPQPVAAPIASNPNFDVGAFSDADNDNGGTRRHGWLVAAMIGGVAVIGGGAAMSLDRAVSPTEVALIQADRSDYKSKPVVEAKVAEARPNPVYDRVTRGANAKAGDPAPTELVTSGEDVSAVRVASVPSKSEGRLTPDAASPNVAPANAALGPRRVRTLKVGPDGQIIRDIPAEPVVQEAATVPSAPVEPAAVEEAAAASTEPATQLEAAEGIPLPRFRPTGLRSGTPSAEPVVVAAATVPAIEQLASEATVSGSEWVVQIASVPSAEAAKNVYADLSSRYRALLGGRGVDYQVAEIANRGTFHRVRVPASGKSEANVLCEQLKAAGGSCFVTR